MSLSGNDWVNLSRLLDEALDLEPAQRTGWMDSLSPEYESLRETLRDLLFRKAGVETAEVLGHAPSFAHVQQAPMASGDAVGPYRLIRELGAGGMATVWLAERSDGTLQRQVALKLPRVAWTDRALAERLNRERDILASLEHPGIARLYDAGVDGVGRPYLALEYVDGIALDKYVAQSAPSIAARLGLFLQIAHAVSYAHARLVVHRDIKPSNILVKADGEVRLLDFGIARLLQPESTANAHDTHFGARAFTPAYAAPEQFTGQPITVSTDVYSLGVLLYGLLSGASPYAADRKSVFELEDAVVRREPIPLTEAVDRSLARALRGDLEMITRKALQKKPADRYETVNAFAEDIERHRQGLPVRAQPERRWYRFSKFVTRHKVSVAAASVTSVALLTGFGAALWQARVAQAEALRAERIKSFIASIFTQAAPRQGVGGVVTASDLLIAANKRIDSELSGNAGDKSELQAMVGASFLALGEPGNARPVLQNALENCAAHASTQQACKLHAAVLLAASMAQIHDDQAALDLLEKYLPALPAGPPGSAEDVVIGYRVRGDVLTNLGRTDEALTAFTLGRQFAERTLGENHEQTLSLLASLADYHNYRNDSASAAEVAAEALRRGTASRGQLRPDVLLTQIERVYGSVLVGMGRAAEAEPIMRRVLDDQRRLDPTDTHRVADCEWILAVVLSSVGKLDEAIRLTKHVIDLERDYAPTDSLARRERLMTLGAMYSAARMPEQALLVAADLDRMSDSSNTTLSTSHLRNSLTRAHALVHSGKWAAAQSVTNEVIEASNEPTLATARIEALTVAALSARLQGNSAQAEKLARQIVEEAQAAQLSHPKRAAFLSEAAASLLAARQETAAREAIERAREEYATSGMAPSVRMSDFLITRARLSMGSGDDGAQRDLLVLTEAWERVNPGSPWHAEALYWLSRGQDASGERELAARNRSKAIDMLKESSLPAMRLLASQ